MECLIAESGNQHLFATLWLHTASRQAPYPGLYPQVLHHRHSRWKHHPWVIPAEVVNASGTAISTSSSPVKIQVGAYDSPAGISPAISGAFAITAAMSFTLVKLRAQNGQLLQLRGSELSVRFDKAKGSLTLRLIDLSGKVARTFSMNRSGTIPLHGLTPGMYHAELVQGGDAVVSELLKFGF